jgi:hypothetical protein
MTSISIDICPETYSAAITGFEPESGFADLTLEILDRQRAINKKQHKLKRYPFFRLRRFEILQDTIYVEYEFYRTTQDGINGLNVVRIGKGE